MCGPYYMYKKRYSAADACHSVRGFVNGSWHSNTLGKEMLCDQDLVMLSDYIRKKSQCRDTPKICRLSVSVVFAPALSSAVPFLFFFFSPKKESGQRKKYPAQWRGTASAVPDHVCALTSAATQKPVLIYLIPPHFLHPRRTVKICQRLRFL